MSFNEPILQDGKIAGTGEASVSVLHDNSSLVQTLSMTFCC